MMGNIAFVSQIEPKKFEEAHDVEDLMMAMKKELNQFERNKVWKLVPRLEEKLVIHSKWVFWNKLDEKKGNVVRNKARLVAQWYNQEEGIDFDKTFSLIARLEALYMLSSFACFKKFLLYKMDFKRCSFFKFSKRSLC